MLILKCVVTGLICGAVLVAVLYLIMEPQVFSPGGNPALWISAKAQRRFFWVTMTLGAMIGAVLGLLTALIINYNRLQQPK